MLARDERRRERATKTFWIAWTVTRVNHTSVGFQKRVDRRQRRTWTRRKTGNGKSERVEEGVEWKVRRWKVVQGCRRSGAHPNNPPLLFWLWLHQQQSAQFPMTPKPQSVVRGLFRQPTWHRCPTVWTTIQLTQALQQTLLAPMSQCLWTTFQSLQKLKTKFCQANPSLSTAARQLVLEAGAPSLVMSVAVSRWWRETIWVLSLRLFPS